MKKRKQVDKETLMTFYQEFPYAKTVLKNKKMNSIEYRKELISNRKNIISSLRDRGFSKKVATKLCNEAINVTKMVYKQPTLKEIKEQLYNEINTFVANLHKIPVIHRKFSTGKAFFLPSNKKIHSVNKHYYIKFNADKFDIIDNKEFNAVATRLLTYVVDNDITSKNDLLLAFVNDKQVLDILDRLEEDLDSLFDIERIEAVEEVVNDQIFTEDYMYPGSRHGACATFIVKKEAEKEKARKAAKFVLMHAINKKPLCIKEEELPSVIINIEGREKNNKKYNNFLKKSVLYKQNLTADPDYYQEDLDSFYTIEERKKKKKITVEDYLKEYGIIEVTDLITI